MSIQIRETRSIDVNGHLVTLVIQSHARAKRLRLRCDPSQQRVFLTHPKGARLKDIDAFFERAQGWMKQQMSIISVKTEFKHGAVIPLLGVDYVVQHQPGFKPNVRLDQTTITVEGEEDRVQSMLGSWLRFHALGILQKKSQELATQIGGVVSNVKVRELKSLWGSCGANGNLTYSWRLIMAPAFVLDYICAHEVSHLKERNHGPKFWSLVESICPDYKEAKLWLRKEGRILFSYG